MKLLSPTILKRNDTHGNAYSINHARVHVHEHIHIFTQYATTRYHKTKEKKQTTYLMDRDISENTVVSSEIN